LSANRHPGAAAFCSLASRLPLRAARFWTGDEEGVIQAKSVNEVDAERDRGGGGGGGERGFRKKCSKVVAGESDEAVNRILAQATMLGNGRI